MSNARERRYKTVPDYRSDPIPVLPTDPADWFGIHRFLKELRALLVKDTKVNDLPATTPTNVSLDALSGGNLIQWDMDPATTAYFIVYRNTVQDLLTAMDIGTVHVGLTKAGSFFDNKRTESAGTDFTYWIYPYSANNKPGQPAIIRGVCWADS